MFQQSNLRGAFWLLGLVSLNLVIASSVPAADMPANLQFGRIPMLPDGGGWSVALPLADTDGQWKLTGGSPQLELIPSPVGEGTWIVFNPRRVGPVSGLLTLQDSLGHTLKQTALAGEVVSRGQDDLPALLIVVDGRETTGRRYLRMEGLPSPTEISVPGVLTNLGAKHSSGWQLVEFEARPGLAEATGSLKLGAEGPAIDVQLSAQESITVLAQATLATGWQYRDLVPLAERLRGSRLRARVGLFGVRADARLLRLYDLAFDPKTRRHSLTWVRQTRLPGIRPDENLATVGIRFSREGAPLGSRSPLFVSLAGERAHLIDPGAGLLNSVRSTGLRTTGAVTSSRVHRNALYSLRRDSGNGEIFLRRWRCLMENGFPTLRGSLSPESLQARLGRQQLRPFALAARRDVSGWPQRDIGENLFLLTAAGNGVEGPIPVSLYSLRMDAREPSKILSVRRRFTSDIRFTVGDPEPSMDVLRTPSVGNNGYPVRVRIGYPLLRAGEIISIAGAGVPYEGPYYVEGVSHRIQRTGYSLDPGIYLRMDHDGENSLLRTYRMVDGQSIVRGSGIIGGVRPLALRSSVRRRHGWALTARIPAGPEDPHQIRFLGNGFPEDFNLPPRVDVGTDLRSLTSRVDLRALVADANEDALAIRWSAPGVEFANPTSLSTRADFPVGVTQVRLRAREASGLYEGRDVMYVTVAPPSAVPGMPALTTGLRGLYPNPANPRVRIAFTMAGRGRVRLLIHDVAGRLICKLLDEVRGAGAYDVDWNGLDDQGLSQSSGVYLVRLISDDGVDQGRVVLLR